RFLDGAEPPARHDHGSEPDETEPGGGAARRHAPWRVRAGARGRSRVAPAGEAVRPASRPGSELAIPLVLLRRKPREPRHQARPSRGACPWNKNRHLERSRVAPCLRPLTNGTGLAAPTTRSLVPDLVVPDAGRQPGWVVVVGG